MFINNKSLLLILALVAGVAYAHGSEDPLWSCQYDQQEREVPQVATDLKEDYDPEGNDHSGRTLQSYNNMVIYPYYGALSKVSAAFRTYIQNQLIPPIIDYYQAAVRIKYPISGLLKISAGSVCGVATPANLRAGVQADLVLVVDADTSASYVAHSSACQLAPGTNRPVSGLTRISNRYLKETSDPLLHERNMVCIMHELMHILGFVDGFYNSWLDYQTGKPIKNPTTMTTLDGYSTKVITAEPIRTMVRDYFGCPTLLGAYLEGTGGSGTAASHFERRQFAYEAMTSGLIYQMQMSKFTLGILESMGWYVPDYSYADSFFFGQGEGCSFLTGSCQTGKYADLCTGSNRGCSVVGRGGGNCASDPASNNCRFQQPQNSYDCENPSAVSFARLPQLQTFGRGANSKCFTGSLSSGLPGVSTSYCFTFTCSGSGSTAQLFVNVGSQSLQCTGAGPLGVNGFSGTIDCPDPVEFCSTVGLKTCPRNCMGRGTCTNGVCVCKAGYKGTDCALNA